MNVSAEAAVAFLSGVGSVLGTYAAFRRVVRRLDDECEQRLAAFREGLHEGRVR